VPYKAFGLGACSFDGTQRFQNQKNLGKYMEGIEKSEDVTTFSEQLTPEQTRLEKMMLGLRRSRGMLLTELNEGLSHEQCVRLDQRIAECKERKLLAEKENRLVLTAAGLAVENEIIVILSI